MQDLSEKEKIEILTYLHDEMDELRSMLLVAKDALSFCEYVESNYFHLILFLEIITKKLIGNMDEVSQSIDRLNRIST